MASLDLFYRKKKIYIITAPNSATSQFNHADMVYQLKLKNHRGAGNTQECIEQLYFNICKKIDEVLGPVTY